MNSLAEHIEQTKREWDDYVAAQDVMWAVLNHPATPEPVRRDTAVLARLIAESSR